MPENILFYNYVVLYETISRSQFRTHLTQYSILVTNDMDFKIGDKFDVIIPGFSPTKARIDNITERNGEKFYHISFQEEHLYTICRVVSERVLIDMIDMFNNNKDHLDDFMMSKDESSIDDFPTDSPEEQGGELDELGRESSSLSDINMDFESNSEDKFEIKAENASNISAEINIGLTSEKQ